jgi:hypothetical protein
MNLTEKTNYQDSWFDQLFILLFKHKMSAVLGQRTTIKGYDGFVDLSTKIMRGRNALQQQEIVAQILQSLVPAFVLKLIRTIFSPTQLVCELNAWFTTLLFEWLVGPCEVIEAQLLSENGEIRTQKSGVKIKKCRYLESSGCVGMCINMCKLPTQAFFTKDFGIPLTMTPNFEDFSCEMVFGQTPPPLTEEAIYTQPCLPQHCTVSKTELIPCPKVRDF